MRYTVGKMDMVVAIIIVLGVIVFMLFINEMQSQLPQISNIEQSEIIQARMQQVRDLTPKETEWKKLIELPLNSQITIHEYKITSVPGGWLYDKDGYQPIFIQDRFNNKRD